MPTDAATPAPVAPQAPRAAGAPQAPQAPQATQVEGARRTGAAGRHVPVLRDRIVGLLAPALTARDGRPEPVYVDGTLGMGGHTEAILEACPDARVVGIDRDTEALRLAGERLARFGDRFTGVHARYDELGAVLEDLGLGARESVDAVLLDLGVSSLQLDEADRGFAYKVDAPLDMRMDQTRGLTAADVLNGYAPGDLVRVIAGYGEEKYARPIVKAIVKAREQEPFTTSGRLVELLHDVIPASSRRQSGHPGKRTFQALRIEVNGELDSLEGVLPAAVDALAVGGRLAVLTYHSLEDRLTKQVLARGTRSTAPSDLPVELPEHRPYLRLVVRGGEEPTAAEIAENSRAASARLRVAERTRSTLTDPRTAPPARRTRTSGPTRRPKGSHA